jgi:hypothetical protein
MEQPAMNGPTGEPIADHVAKDIAAADMVDASVATWRNIETALAPIIGINGVAALYKRSLHLASSVHPWLAVLREGDPTTVDLSALESIIMQQTGAQAADGTRHLLQTFHQLLGSLVGPSLTERLLRPVRAGSLGEAPLQDAPR